MASCFAGERQVEPNGSRLQQPERDGAHDVRGPVFDPTAVVTVTPACGLTAMTTALAGSTSRQRASQPVAGSPAR